MATTAAPDPTPHSTPLLAEVKMRLNASALPHEVASLVLGALEGVDENQRAAVRGVYLKSITARGFRGIGPSQTLAINPGPGLTVITGRNGSGKSSFSEAVEVALTGRNRRWDDEKGNVAQPIQQGGWRNLHEPNHPRIDLELSVSGRPDPVVITRTWAGSAFNESTAVVAGLGDQPLPPSALGWENDLTSFRPVLAYSELGQMTSAKQSQMYDALAKLLGLGSLAEAYDHLGEREKRLKEDGKQADALLPILRADLADVDDERAARAARALAGKTPDREEIRSLVSGAAPSSSSEQARLYRLAGLVGPDLTAVADAVARAREAVATADDARYTRTGWHLWHNLCEAVEKCVTRHSSHLREPALVPDATATAAAVAALESAAREGKAAGSAHHYADRTHDRHRAVHDLLDQGHSQRAIAQALGLARNTVRRFARAATATELSTGKWQNLPSILDPYKPYLHQRWQEGCTNARTLFEEIRAAGFRGQSTIVRAYLRPLRSGLDPADRACTPPSVRDVTGWITRHPDSPSSEETLKIKSILARCPQLSTAAEQVRSFAEMMRDPR